MHGGRENYRCDKFINRALGLTSGATGRRNQYAGRQRATINRRNGLGFNDATLCENVPRLSPLSIMLTAQSQYRRIVSLGY